LCWWEEDVIGRRWDDDEEAMTTNDESWAGGCQKRRDETRWKIVNLTYNSNNTVFDGYECGTSKHAGCVPGL